MADEIFLQCRPDSRQLNPDIAVNGAHRAAEEEEDADEQR
jgi:hypothetical protein